MAIETKNLLVWVKAMSRGQALPLDASEIYESLDAAQSYASNSAIAYAGQTVKALVDGKYHTYTLQPSESGYILEESGVSTTQLKQYVQIVDTLPVSDQEEGVIYISGTTGYIWNGTEWKTVFTDLSSSISDLQNRMDSAESALDEKAPLANPAFTGSVTIDGDTAATKSYVDGLIGNLVSSAPGVVDSTHPLPTEGYKAGQTFRVAEAGTYAGYVCEVGDLIICIADYAESASNSDFMVVQGNTDGGVTSSANAATVGEIVVFDAVTGKVIGSSGVQIDSLRDAISKAHEHSNKNILDSYDLTEDELLASAKAEAQGIMDTLSTAIDTKLADKAGKDEIPDAYTKAEVNDLLTPITTNLNTKLDEAAVSALITASETKTAEAYNEAISTAIGEIPEGYDDVKTYVDATVQAGGVDQSAAIATAKTEAIAESKAYTDSVVGIIEF